MRPPLLIALAVALAATLWLQQGEEDTGDIQVAERPRAGARPEVRPEVRDTEPAATQAWLVDRVQALQAQRVQVDALPPPRAMSATTPSAWAAAVPPAPPAPRQARAVDAAPVAPPFPHQWVGRFDDDAMDGKKALRRAVISGPVSTWVAREGDVIEGQWRVDQIQERLMRLTYLPLQQSQTVAMK
ncbi:hypothetical protein [Aquabacterium parvum]|uniref:hypothetical protein n=1 Tax=Aquabacterium parvum TaxID=70584 RepID=UPI00128FBEE7|nr:hypothetical protein [Aquabacterium parvum]MBU0918259.1 hypothetical protein [Gammaproteobacteria bacterium]